MVLLYDMRNMTLRDFFFLEKTKFIKEPKKTNTIDKKSTDKRKKKYTTQTPLANSQKRKITPK